MTNKSKKKQKQKAKILLIGTFHMHKSNDANQINFNQEKDAYKLNPLIQKLISFKPTKIGVEVSPKNQNKLNKDYRKFKKTQNPSSIYQGEIGLIAYPIALSIGHSSLYGLNSNMEYDYPKIDKLARKTNSRIYLDYLEQTKKKTKKIENLISSSKVLQALKYINSPKMIEFLINVNADILTYVNSPNKYDGADIASEYYKRNIRIFANIHRLKLTPDDRLLIIMGASHIAFLQKHIERSPIYELEKSTSYFKI